jgi:hypothetical protein
MSKTKRLAATKFSVGTKVRVKTGVTLPDLPDIPLGNWAGTISEVFADNSHHVRDQMEPADSRQHAFHLSKTM